MGRRVGGAWSPRDSSSRKLVHVIAPNQSRGSARQLNSLRLAARATAAVLPTVDSEIAGHHWLKLLTFQRSSLKDSDTTRTEFSGLLISLVPNTLTGSGFSVRLTSSGYPLPTQVPSHLANLNRGTPFVTERLAMVLVRVSPGARSIARPQVTVARLTRRYSVWSITHAARQPAILTLGSPCRLNVEIHSQG